MAHPWLKQVAKQGHKNARSGNIWAAMACSGGVSWHHGEFWLSLEDVMMRACTW